VNCIAHRGFAGVNPENTVAAVEAAVAAGADGVEVDLRRCGSGELVVCHDESVDRTTGGTGPVADHTADELAALSVEGADAGVPTFAAVLDACPGSVTLHAELKERGLGRDVDRAVADAAPSVVVSSFDPDAVAEVESAPTALTVWDVDGAVERAADLGCAFLHPHHGDCDAALVERARGAGLGVNAWTVTEPAETGRLRAAGADGVITDFPECCPGRD
jgi:glycerophosphoryl diester phosphodiesterase